MHVKLLVGGLLLGLGFGILIGAKLVAGNNMGGLSVVPSLLLAMAGAALTANGWREFKARR